MATDPHPAIVSGGSSSLKILEAHYRLRAVDEQTTDLLKTAEHVNRNINEARRLRRLKAALLNPEEQAWMDATIADTTKALQDIAQLIEPARVDASLSATRSMNPRTKALWIFRDSSKARDKHNKLTICHQSLIGVINGLYAKDVVVAGSLNPVGGDAPPPAYNEEMEKMLNWQRQKRRRRGTSSLQHGQHEPRASLVTVSTMPMGSPQLRLNLDRHMSLTSLLSEGTTSSEAAESVLGSEDTTSQRRADSISESVDTAERHTSTSNEIGDTSTEASSGANDMTSPPTSVANSMEGADGLQVVDYQPYRLSAAAASSPPQEAIPSTRLHPVSRLSQQEKFWSPVNVGLESVYESGLHPVRDMSPLPEAVSPAVEKVASGLESFSLRDGQAPVEENTGGIKAEGDAQKSGRSSARSRGRQWLAGYAVRSDVGLKSSGA